MRVREWRLRVASFLMLLAGLLLVACGEPDRMSSAPPPIVLRSAAGAEQSGAVGPYCWSEGGRAMCASGPLVIPAVALPVQAGECVQLDFGHLGTPTETHYMFYRYDAASWRHDGSARAPRIAAVIPDDPVRQGTLSPTPVANLQLDLPPGEYALVIFARIAGGDTTQGFYLTVE